MKKSVLTLVLLSVLLLAARIAFAETNIHSPYLTYLNGSWYYWVDTALENPRLMARDAATGEDRVLHEGWLCDSAGNSISVDGLTNDGRSLIVLDTGWNELLRVDADHPTQTETLFVFPEDHRFCRADLALCGGYLFVKWVNNDRLVRYDLRDGTQKQLALPRVVTVFPLRDGTLLVQQAIGTDAPDRLLVIDPETCEIQRVFATFEGNSRPAVAVDAASDRVYAAFDAAVWTWAGEQWTKVRDIQYSSPFGMKAKARCAGSSFYVQTDMDSWQAFHLDKQAAYTPVSILGVALDRDLDTAYMLEHPGQVIARDSGLSFLTAEDLYTKLLTRDDSFDIYAVLLTEKVAGLIRQGTFPKLNGTAFDAYADALYAPFAESLTVDHALCAVPDAPMALSFEVKPDQGVDAPESMAALIDLLEHWDEHPANAGQPLLMMNGQQPGRKELLLLCLHQLIDYQARGEELWTRPSFAALLEKIRDAKLPADRTLSDEAYESVVMCLTDGSISLQSPYGLQPPLRLCDELAMLAPMDLMTVMVVNPYARHPEEAASYLAYRCGHAALQDQRLMFRTLEPALLDRAVQRIEALEKEKQQTVRDADRQQLEREIEAERNDPYNYTASPEVLAMYREKIVPQLVPVTPELIAWRSAISIRPFLEKQANRYLNGQLSTRQLLDSIRQQIEMSKEEDR